MTGVGDTNGSWLRSESSVYFVRHGWSMDDTCRYLVSLRTLCVESIFFKIPEPWISEFFSSMIDCFGILHLHYRAHADTVTPGTRAVVRPGLEVSFCKVILDLVIVIKPTSIKKTCVTLGEGYDPSTRMDSCGHNL